MERAHAWHSVLRDSPGSWGNCELPVLGGEEVGEGVGDREGFQKMAREPCNII